MYCSWRKISVSMWRQPCWPDIKLPVVSALFFGKAKKTRPTSCLSGQTVPCIKPRIRDATACVRLSNMLFYARPYMIEPGYFNVAK